jgi:hypothetical protein
MRKALLLAAGLVLVGTPAWGQNSPSGRDDGLRDRWHDRWDGDRDEPRGRSMRDEDDDDRTGRGARFVLRSGDTQLRVVCGGEESTRACVDAALTLFDRVQSQRTTPRTAAPATPAPGSSPAPRFQ